MIMNNEGKKSIFEPVNNLEESIVSAQNGEMQMSEFMPMLIDSQIYVPSIEEVQPDGQGLKPLFFDRQGKAMVAIFTDLSRITNDFKIHAQYCLGIVTRNFLIGLPKDFGIVINPSHPVGLEVSSDGIQKLIEDLEKV
jgi:hypothetical protein